MLHVNTKVKVTKASENQHKSIIDIMNKFAGRKTHGYEILKRNLCTKF
jgi:hypothetical protein